ncbi:MAG: sodium:solute symporter family protein [Candidatus Cardinium sp.]
MMPFNVSLFVVGIFLLLTLVVGVYFSRKEISLREYAVGNKQFATATLVATVLASALGGGGLVRSVEQVYNTGLYWITLFLLHASGFYIISCLSLRMGPFMKHLSIAETIGSIYGKFARLIVALSNICYSIVVVTGQISVMSLAISMCIDSVIINPKSLTVVATIILIFYSVFGGIRAVTFTDVLQFTTFTIIIPILAWYMLIRTGKSPIEITSFLKSRDIFQHSKLFNFNIKLISLISLCLSNIVSRLEPLNIQRVYMSSTPIQARSVFLYATLFDLIIKLFIILVGLFVFVGEPGLPVSGIWDYIMVNIPPYFKGIVSVSLLAMTMSTADSILNSCSITVSHDILGVIIESKKAKKISDTFQMRLARFTTLIVGISSMVFAFYCRDLLKILYWTLDLSVPIVTAPFVLSIFGFRGASRTALIGMATGTLTILSWNKWIEPSTGMNGAFISMVANGLAMMAAHYFLKQPENAGWIGPDDTFKQIQQENARKGAERKETIKNAWANKKITFSKMVPSPTTMVYVGLYTTITSLLVYFTVCITNHSIDLILQLFVSACFIGYPFLYDISKKIRAIPKWFIGLLWFVWLAVYLPKNLIWNCWNLIDPILATS